MSEPGGADQPVRELLPTATGRQVRHTLAELLRPRRWLAGRALGLLVGSTAVGLLTAPLLGYIVDLVVEGRPPAAITTPTVLLGLVAVVQGVTLALGLSQVARLGEGMLADLRERFIDRVLDLPLEQVERAGSGDLTARVTGDVTVIAEAVRTALPQLARSGLTIALTLVGLAVLDWRFLLAALLAVPIQLHTARWYARRAQPLYASQRVAHGAQQQQLLDTVGGARTVRAFRLTEPHLHRVSGSSVAAVELTLRGIRLMTRFFGRLNLAEFVGLTGVLVTGFLLVRADAVSVGTASAAALYFHNLFGPLNAALSLVDDAQSAVASLVRLVGVTGLPVRRQPENRPVPVDGGVETKELRHAYVPGHDVLHDVTLHVAPNERVALVGASGAGKTTLAKLIAGIHRPSGGGIRLGGVPIEDLGVVAGRTVGLVSQEVHVFAGPLAEDLRLAGPDATDEELLAALDRVGALGWVRALPDGLATVVGDGGHRLTAAQAQQLALARLVLAAPPVAILDEATAEAGSAGARQLETAAARALDGRTGLVVAHRLTQAAAADRIIVLDAGRVAETGTHDELVAAGGRYAALWAAWTGTRETPRPDPLPEQRQPESTTSTEG
ncbi:multidrug ABC transporter permease [Plantactinospora sp. BC1]|uniref:ABC transporter ATP-binding protein n=1 Tax=Plantactinospora sp. BC1 TaxID=2108470 RepID=UPI000D167DFC|nr:ABC transporter ATP-binding protein [Plantactinospora sp. BC1]AVT28959.1 multidrug ABC transporter permease [Plantactinospora sp. BC1]